MPPPSESVLRVDAARALAFPIIGVLFGVAVLRVGIPRVQAPLVALRAERDRLQSAVASMASLSPAEVAALREAAASDGAAVAAADAVIPATEDPTRLLGRLDRAAREANVALGVLAPTQDSVLAPVVLLPYGASPYQVRVRGSWAAITTLLADAARDPALVLPSVRGLRLAAAPGGDLSGDLVFTLVSHTPSAAALAQADSSARADSVRAAATAAAPAGARR